MFSPISAFSGFSVDDLAKSKAFYADTLGLTVDSQDTMGLRVNLPGGGSAFIYQKDDHQPATFTIMNFVVKDIDQAAEALESRGVHFERYNEGMIKTDDKGIARGLANHMGPDIAWFKDPAGNILAILQPE